MKPATFASALLSMTVLLGASLPAAAQVPDFCYEFNDQDGDRYVYGRTGLVCPREDCNDNDPNIHPTATEVCGDTIDQDCKDADMPPQTTPRPGGETGSQHAASQTDLSSTCTGTSGCSR